ncbi:MAG: ABC transporter ATP-binding protein [Acetatifactor sp.]
MIEVTDLTKKYGDNIAVDHLSFKVEKGQIYGFLGPNGAGKSTTMNIITGYLAATEGTVTIDGKDIQKEPEEVKRKIGYLPELPPLYMDMTVEEYLMFAAELKKVPANARRQQVEEVMERTGVSNMRNRLIRNLSKGYKQRVGLSQAILGDPQVLILDEPSVGLDPKQIIEMRDLILKLGENHTVILSSHILSEISAICDHVIIIAHGRLIANDTTEGLQKRLEDLSELELTVRGEYGQVRDVLEKIDEIKTVEQIGSAEDNCVLVKVISREKQDIREKVFFALAEAGIPLREMISKKKSLEEIFLELTQEVDEEEAE